MLHRLFVWPLGENGYKDHTVHPYSLSLFLFALYGLFSHWI